MADSFDQFQTLVRERLADAVLSVEFTDVTDPLWSMIGQFMPESMGGRREYDTGASDYPAGYEAKYKIKVQSGGLVTGGSFSGNTLVAMGKDSHLASGQGADALYPDPALAPMASWVTIKMVLKRILGVVSVNDQQLTAKLASQTVDEVAGDEAIDAAKRVRNTYLNGMYGDGTATIAQCLAGASVTETAGGVTVTLKNGTYARFMKGDIIVAGSNANPRVQRAGAIAGRMNVVSIDPDGRHIKLQSRPGEGTITLSADDHLMLDGMYVFGGASDAVNSRHMNGLDSLLINTGVFPNSTSPEFPSGLDVAHHTELKAFIQDDSAAMVEPTMENLTLLLDKIEDAGLVPPTAIISERGVWTRWAQLERENHATTMIPQGGAFQAAGGVAGPVLTHMGRTFQKFVSARVRPNAAYGIAPDTFMNFVPLGDRAIHWKLERTGSIFYMVQSGRQLTELSGAPFNTYGEFGCRMPPRNWKHLGLLAQRDN